MRTVLTIALCLLMARTNLAESRRSLDSLTDYLESHELSGGGGNTTHCFASYLPELELVGDTWSKAYSGCEQQAASGRGTLLTSVGGMQQTMRQAAQRIDSYIGSCLSTTNVLDYFECFAKLSKQQLANMYAISVNASENALSLTRQLDGIDAERYLCTNRTERSYVLGTARIFDALDKCLQQAASAAQQTTD